MMGFLDVLIWRDVASVDGFDPVAVNEPDSGSKPPFRHPRERPAAFVPEAPKEEPKGKLRQKETTLCDLHGLGRLPFIPPPVTLGKRCHLVDPA
jgi:hypothetical protein